MVGRKGRVDIRKGIVNLVTRGWRAPIFLRAKTAASQR